MAYYDKETSDELKDKFKDLAKPNGADFSGLIDYFDKGLQGMDDKGDKGDTAVIGENSVNTINLVDKASTYAKRTVLGNITSVNCTKKPANYDTAAGTLTIYKGTIVTHGKGNFETSADVVLDVIGTGSRQKKIMFDTITNTFFALPYNDYTSVNDENCLFLGTVNSYPDNQTINLVFDCTIDGIYPTVSKEKSIPTKSLNINSRVSRIILNSNGQFPNMDTSNRTLTFYNDTILVLSTGEYYILPETVVDLTIDPSSALKIYYDTFNKVFTVRAYGKLVNEDNWIFVCAVRTSIGALSIPCAYNVNGKPFGLTIPDSVVKNPLNAHVKAVLHRGYNTVAPENTIPAYELAKKMGFSYVETDVKWTSDGVPILLHDGTVDRTSDGTGAIADLTFSYARSLDFGSWKGSEYVGTLIPTFEEFILSCKKLNLHPYIHINELVTVEKAQELVGIVRKQGMIRNVSWISFTTAALTNICTAYPKSRIGMLSGTFDGTILDDARALKTTENDVFLDVDTPALTKEMIEAALSEDIYVETYTVDYSNLVEGYVNMGVSGITTNSLNIAEILGNTY
ncbi:phosphodiesterase [Lactobacillus phage Iacchus]|uniref:Glycerophosphodiester phosphodiesterase n=2 Tax=Harbinvirus TaxID=2732970 RepID=A0A3Q8I5J9_9CAUD|nr:phosphodiesterase [Lactobacillus phage Iacchus]YP_009814461.1 phosphodiesterase [Lactobacillus phage Bromius]AYH91968.1 glycerophosphoryldiester phosphodiesterase [Lactobacillus phage Iacchus]AYH92140.1 glycerophosphodiester phosphodiesterase [Lactobacillus phage Dionysus]AYH92310.1 glycerophosphodiester phosphodiesterase [Lactobacillus phage Bromius]